MKYIHTNALPPQNNTGINDSLFQKQIDMDKIIKIIGKIKNHNSYFENNLTNYILKNVSNSIVLPLSIIFNRSLSTGKYLATFKKCIIKPVYKAGDKLSCENYISLSLTSKIFEKCIKIGVLDNLEKKIVFFSFTIWF
jgi:hypothetical protein